MDFGSFHRETILVKGARTFGLERVIRRLQQKTHETVLEINLDALTSNINYFRSKLLPDVRLMAVVKAFGYGSGSIEIAHLLEFNSIDYLAVAYADEGVELRNAGIELPIMVMNPEEQSFELMITHKLEPEIYSIRTLDAFLNVVRALPAVRQPLLIHLKLDTGMHRLGFSEAELDAIVLRLRDQRNVRLASVFSHLAASDEPEHDAFTQRQSESFRRMCKHLEENLETRFMRHLLNTGGVSRWPDLQFEMVRLGIGMHGISGCREDLPHLLATTRMKSVISQIRHLKAGESVGYSRKGVLQRDSVIATIPVGYADGYSRKMGNGRGKMIVAGKPAPTVGNICMDMCMIDITGIEAREGDEVTVFGEGYSINEMAHDMETIPYEVLASVSSRVKRVYYHE
jgi:alanine racemase